MALSRISRLPLIHALLLGWLLLVQAGTAAAEQRTLELYEGDVHPLNPYATVLNDPDGTYTIDDILTPELNARFETPANPTLSYGFVRDYKWIKLNLAYPAGAPNVRPRKEWFLEIGRIQMEIAEVYLVDKSGFVQMQSADMQRPFEQRRIRHVHSVVPIELKLGGEYTVYIRAYNNTAFFLPLNLWVPEAFVAKNKTESLLYGIFYGGMLVMILYNLFLFYSTQDRNYLLYIGYLLCATLFEFIDLGHGVDLIPGGHDIFNERMLTPVMLISFVVGIRFATSFLEYPTRYPVMNRFMNTWCVILLINLPSTFLLSYTTTINGVAFLCTASIVIVLYLGIHAWIKGNPNAMFFTFAWISNIVGFMVLSMSANGHIPPSAWTQAAPPIGVFVEAVVFSFALAERIKRIERSALYANHMAVVNLTRFRSVFDNALEGLYQMSLKGRITTANPSFLRLMNIASLNDLAVHNQPLREALFPDPHAMLSQLAIKGRLVQELHLTHGDGLLLQHSAQLIRDAHGAPLHIEGTIIDLSERMARDRVHKERLRERREKQLAKRATDEKTEFLKAISYEIRTPLTAIMGFSETLKTAVLEPGERPLVIDAILRNSHRLLRLINDILDYSKIEAGKMPVESLDVSLAALLTQIEGQMRPLALQKNLGFNVQISYPVPPTFRGDPTRMRQILENLVLHAIDVSPSGTVTLEVRWNHNAEQLEWNITDQAPPLDAAGLQRLFQTLGKGHASVGHQTMLGSGLGVLISRQLCQLTGGQLVAAPLDRQGNRFTVTLPTTVPPEDTWLKAAPTSQRQDTRQDVPQLSGHILLAEDNAVNQQLIQRVIRKTGAQVSLATDGQQALDAGLRDRFDLILMDVNMPVMGGLDATRELRHAGYSGPIYALTAEQGEAEVRSCLEAGCNGHLGKPLQLAAFYDVLARYLAAKPDDVRQSGLH